MSTLSVLYVVRNEEELIGKSLSSISQVADEIVVVDTGSRDRTIQVCRQFRNVRILAHSWTHDFSKTKNYGISQCKSDWVLCLDADEMLDAESADGVRQAVDKARSNVSAFGLHVVDHEQAWGPTAPANQASYFPSPQVRLFRRGSIYFQGRVMETVDALALAAGSIDLLPAKIHHYLWRGRGKEFAEARLGYYKKLGASVPELREERLPPLPVAEQVGIVVVASNCLNLTRECLSSITRHTKCPYSLHLVDNGSGDGTSDYMTGVSGKPAIRLSTNYGAARGRNMGIRDAMANPAVKYVCLLDNDTKVSDNWVESMMEILKSNADIGVVAPQSLNSDGPQKFDNQPAKPKFTLVESVSSFCMLMPVDAFRKVGLLDESFGQYGFYELDFCQRAKDAGYKIAVSNHSFVDHLGKGTVVGNRINWEAAYSMAAVKFKKKWKDAKVPPLMATATPVPIQWIGPRMANPKTSVIILTHNRLDMTKECLSSLCSTLKDSELIVVDNGSSDGTVNWIRTNVPYAVILENGQNVGIPRARNQGIRLSRGDNVVLMDNDVVVQAGWLEDLYAEMGKGFDIVGIEGWQLDVNFTPVMKCERKGDRVDYIGGACTLTKRAVYERAGLLDEGFSPAYFEDSEMCLRAKTAGFKFSWLPTKKIEHREHATLLNCQKTFSYQSAWDSSHRRMQQIGRKEIKPEIAKLPPKDVVAQGQPKKKLRILYLGMQYDYGDRNKGSSFEQDNFLPSLKAWDKTEEVFHFDFVEFGQRHGIPRMTDMLMDAVKAFAPDAIFSIFFDQEHDPNREIFNHIRRTTKVKSIGWFCDSHYRFDNFDSAWAPYLDFCVTTSQVAVPKYVSKGFGKKVIKSQWFASPSYKKIPGTDRDIAVSFVGQPHGDRKQVVRCLQESGITIQTFGTGWGKRLSFDEMVRTFNRSKINLNLNNAADVTFKQIKGRNFEVPACGGFLLTGSSENLADYYVPDKEIVTFAGLPQLLEKIRYYLSHDSEREAIALAGYERTMREHTYAKRFDEIFKAAGLLEA